MKFRVYHYSSIWDVSVDFDTMELLIIPTELGKSRGFLEGSGTTLLKTKDGWKFFSGIEISDKLLINYLDKCYEKWKNPKKNKMTRKNAPWA